MQQKPKILIDILNTDKQRYYEVEQYIPTDEEVWRSVVGFEGHYDVSNKGRMKSLQRTIETELTIFIFKERIMKLQRKWDYLGINIRKNKKYTQISVHRLVAQAFLSNPNNHPQVNHKNGIKHDNRVENLEWVTAKENTNHAFTTGLKVPLKGEENPMSKITEEMVRGIREVYATGHVSQVNVAKQYGITRDHVKLITQNRIWKHVK